MSNRPLKSERIISTDRLCADTRFIFNKSLAGFGNNSKLLMALGIELASSEVIDFNGQIPPVFGRVKIGPPIGVIGPVFAGAKIVVLK